MTHPARNDPETVYTITKAPRSAAPVAPYVQLRPVAAEMPLPGAELVTLPGGEQQWAYVRPRADPVPVTPARQPIPAWAKTAALLMWSASGSAALGGYGLSLAGPWLKALAYMLMAVAVAVTVVAFVVRGLSSAPRRRGGGGSTTAEATATATGRTVLGGKVTATATAIATNK
ncbi:hypothetical protein EES39_38240 [Streptomyces sp. ADI92-24]|uniref:hypothetical protein n=1 Tax=Streptomyces sp. ADI92-24 TaxID=1522756 RepID=UPI000F551B9D|nr:hypothetical protein [Streptomyces sp. ADI92-24]RPK32643.1 hypothetical protein EES39_38240 [Streptomyces sp. ADI92-24]